MLEPKYKLGQRVYVKPVEKNGRPILETIYTISLDNSGDIVYNNYYNEDDLFIATEWGDVRCKELKCSKCPFEPLNCFYISGGGCINQEKTLKEMYEILIEKTGYTIPKLKEKLLSPYDKEGGTR